MCILIDAASSGDRNVVKKEPKNILTYNLGLSHMRG
jgi:hypothetical protein